jgi:hypothetical protein
MRQRGTPVGGLVQLDDLRQLAGGPGPYLSLYLTVPPPIEDLGGATALAWRDLRNQAAQLGAPEALLASVDPQVEDAHREGAGLGVVTAPAGEAHVEHLALSPGASFVRWEPTPALLPLVAVRQRLQPHVVVLVDRVGADVFVRGADSDPTTPASETTVEGRTHPIRKVGPGGWSQRRFQQRAEETWEHNMRLVADEVSRAASDSGARLVAVGGDQRAAGMLTERLPTEIQSMVRPLAVTRSPDGSTTHLDEEVGRLLEEWADEQIAGVLATFREELGQHDRARAGPTDTLEALRSARVAQLLVRFTPEDHRRVWIGDAPEHLSVHGDGETADSIARTAPLMDAAAAGALATGADVCVLPAQADVPGDLGALLRW